MRISAENAALLNWDAIAGEAKTIPINVGSIRISRPGTPGKRKKAE